MGKKIAISLEHPSKANATMEVTLVGITIFVRPDSSKADCPIASIDLQ